MVLVVQNRAHVSRGSSSSDQEILTAETHDAQNDALQELITIQTQDFVNVLEPMDSKPVTIRLLDAPLHEFLEDSHEQNPMLGLRGVRLALVTENLYRAQTRALISAASKQTRSLWKPNN